MKGQIGAHFKHVKELVSVNQKTDSNLLGILTSDNYLKLFQGTVSSLDNLFSQDEKRLSDAVKQAERVEKKNFKDMQDFMLN